MPRLNGAVSGVVKVIGALPVSILLSTVCATRVKRNSIQCVILSSSIVPLACLNSIVPFEVHGFKLITQYFPIALAISSSIVSPTIVLVMGLHIL